MNIELKGIHYDISESTRDFIIKKLQKVDFAKNLITDLLLTITKEKKAYKIDCTINFRWAYSAHLSADGIKLYEGIEKLIDKIEAKVHKEKDKIKEHQHLA